MPNHLASRQDTCMEAKDEVVELTRDLIRIDTSNFGDHQDTRGEAEAAAYCAERLREVGWSPEVYTTTGDRRRGVWLRIEGAQPGLPALVVHGHLDVVPAIADEWTFPPFAAEIHDGFIWGRGAVDMKNMDAMILAIARRWGRGGVVPRRDIIIVFFPDEEAGMVHGSQWVVRNRPEFFEGAGEAIGEVGGFSMSIPGDRRLYPIQTAEKGIRWMRLRARRRAGHGSLIHPDNAVSEIARAVSRIADHVWPEHLTPTAQTFLTALRQAFGADLDPSNAEELAATLGGFGALVQATARNTANPTMLAGGYKVNVIPNEAEAAIDGRVLPGSEAEFEATVRDLIGPDIELEIVNSDIAVEADMHGPIFTAMAQALLASDPESIVAPYMISGGTDAKALSTLGIACYGFSPLQMPPGLDYWRLFHGVDERVPIAGLEFGIEVLDRFLRSY